MNKRQYWAFTYAGYRTHNRKRNQSTETDPGMTYMRKLVNKYIK